LKLKENNDGYLQCDMLVTYDVIWWILTMWYDGYLWCDMMVTYGVTRWLLTMWYDG